MRAPKSKQKCKLSLMYKLLFNAIGLQGDNYDKVLEIFDQYR